MPELRALVLRSTLCGALAGLVWFAVQYLAVVPLIQRAETYEAAAQEHAAESAHHDSGTEWHPSEGFERSALTAAATVLTGIGLAAIFLGTIAVFRQSLDLRRGLLWGLAGFVCFHAAPALGLPPQPPGVELAPLPDRQLWWAATVLLTGAGLLLLLWRSQRWYIRLCGVLLAIVPHAAGAPTGAGTSVVPAGLVRQFTTASLGAALVFWITLGIAGGLLRPRSSRV